MENTIKLLNSDQDSPQIIEARLQELEYTKESIKMLEKSVMQIKKFLYFKIYKEYFDKI